MSEEFGGGGESTGGESNVSENTSGEDSHGLADDGGTPIEDSNAIRETAERMLKKYKVKVDGEDLDVSEDELLSNYQLRKASDKRFQEGMQARKQAEEFIRLLKTDPTKVLSHPSVGLDAKKWAEEYLINEMQREMMTPEQRQMEEYKSKLAKYEEQEQMTKKQQEEAQQAQIRQKYTDDYNKQIVGALDSSGLPKTEFTVQRMIHYMAKALENNYEVGANDVVDLVRRDYINDTKSLYSGLDADALIQILGDDVASKIRKADLNKIRNPQRGKVPSNAGIDTNPSTGGKSEKLSKDEWREMLEKIQD